jgi:hypothetical protein
VSNIEPKQGLKAIVNSIKTGEETTHGPYAVAKAKGIRKSITFSLRPAVWQEDKWPDPGTFVYLDKLEERRAGWRAGFGRLWQPSDEAQAAEQGTVPKQSPKGTRRQK